MENHHFSYGKSPLFRFPLGSSVGKKSAKAENHGISVRSCGSSRFLPEILWLQPLRSGSRSADEDRRWRWGRRIESHAGPVGGPGETAGSVMEILEDSRFRNLGVQVIFPPKKRLWALMNGDMRGPFEWRYFCHITYPKQDCGHGWDNRILVQA